MQVLGIDLGFSSKYKTSCYCAFKVDSDTKEIGFLLEPTKFNYKDKTVISMIRTNAFDVITLDAPMTPKHIDETEKVKPKTGRMIEKAFSVDIFHGSKRGPQPSSIAVPKQGWPFYCAGMKFSSNLKPYRYLSINDIQNGRTTGIYEVIPKLTQALLAPRDVLIKRKAQIDNYLFPVLFHSDSQYRYLINNILNEYYFSLEIEDYIQSISKNTKIYHEELAAFVCAFQAFIINIGRASIIGFDGDYEAYYALPDTSYWEREWLDCFYNKSRAKFPNIHLIKKGVLQTQRASKPVNADSFIYTENITIDKLKSRKKSAGTTESTTEGYINKNNQKNLGKTDRPGSGHLQWFYQMQCLKCGHEYYANGHDIWLRKCPVCQGGRP
ncbi:MAG: hypothetical protein ACM3S4_08920 [Burkholderiales bacterium]